MKINLEMVTLFLMSGIVTSFGFMLRYWFNKLNISQSIIISDMKVLMEHKYSSTAEIHSIKENNKSVHEKMFLEMKDLSRSMNNSYEKILTKVESNSLEISNLKSENRIIASNLKHIIDRGKNG